MRSFALPLLIGLLACDSPTPKVGGSPDGAVVVDGAASKKELVVVTLNTHSFQEGDDSLEKLRQIGEGLAELDADIVSLNEVMSGTFWAYDYNGAQYDGTAIIQEALERASGVTWYAETFGFASWADGEQMSNVLLSREPLQNAESRELSTTDSWPAPASRRNVGHGRVVIPSVGSVHLFVTHTWGWDSVDTLAQIQEVKAFVEEKKRGDEVLELVMGDLNVPSTSASFAQWIEGAPLPFVDTYGAANPDGLEDSTTVDGANRIDYILASRGSPLLEAQLPIRSRLVFDGSALPLVSDHRGVATTFVLRP